MSRKQLSPTSFAILGLLSIQPFTTYELAQQMDRTLSWFWPRAASMIYEEPKKLAAAGLATSRVTFTGKRRSTVYEITDAGRAALRDWLDTPASGMRMESEAMIKVAFADAGNVTQLRAAVREIRADAETQLAEILSRSTEYAATGGPFPDRLPIVAITGKLLMGQYEAVVRWARWAEDAIGEWTGVTPAIGAIVPPYAFTSGWPKQYIEDTTEHRNAAPCSDSAAKQAAPRRASRAPSE
jgi:DNA-binding PadR family transcriptional regulator